MSKDNVQVKVVRPIWTRGQVISPRVYVNPDENLIKIAREQAGKSDPIAILINGVKTVNEDAITPPAGDSGIDADVDTDVVLPTVDAITPEVNEDVNEDDESFATNFITVEEFENLTSTKQQEYVVEIQEVPADLTEEEAGIYDKALFDALVSYRGVAKAKAESLIEEVLAEYED